MARTQQKIALGSSSIYKPSWTVQKIKRCKIKAANDDSTIEYEIVFPFGPNRIKYDNHNGQYDQIDRPLVKPLNVFSKPSLRVVTFEALIVHRRSGGLLPGPRWGDGDSVQEILDKLQTISQTGMTCKFIYGVTRLPYKCFLTNFTYTAERRSTEGEILSASVNIQLTEKVSYNPDASELPLIVRPPVNVTVKTGGGGGVNYDVVEDALPLVFGQKEAEARNLAINWARANGVTDPTRIKSYYNVQLNILRGEASGIIVKPGNFL